MGLETFSGQFKLYDNAIDVTTGFGALYSVANQIDCAVNINENDGTYAVTSVDNDNASALLKAYYNGYEIYKTFSISKERPQDGLNRYIVLDTSHYFYQYDGQNAVLPQDTDLTVTKYNTLAAVSWNIRRLDNSLIASGDGADLVSLGYASAFTDDSITITATIFDGLCKAFSTSAIIFEAVVKDASRTYSDRLTLYQLLQKSKVTWDNIADPTGQKARTVSNAYNSAFIAAELERNVDLTTWAQIQALAATSNNVFRVEKTSVEAAQQAVSIVEGIQANVEANGAAILQEIAVLADDTSANAESINALAARVNNVNGSGKAIEAVVNNLATADVTEAAARASAITAVQTDYNGKIGNVQTQLNSTVNQLGNVENRWTVSLNAGGNAIAGLVLANGSNSKSVFGVQADNFYLLNGSGNGSSPFQVIDGVTYIKEANIQNATIGTWKLADSAATTQKIALGAVTNYAYAFTPDSFSMNSDGEQTLQTATLTTYGHPVWMNLCHRYMARLSGARIKVYRDSETIGNIVIANSFTSSLLTITMYSQNNYQLVDNPSSGTHTYTITVVREGADVTISNRFLYLLELKR